ncbi:hypothetical protein A2U01_0032070, partial [Trifolium medium]|nr:hypothetical protein [Trifolium medium]
VGGRWGGVGVAAAVEGVGECQTLLLNLSLQDQTSDRWQWQPDPDKGYIVRGAYQLLTSQDAVTHKNKPGHPRYHIIGGSLLCFWLWSGRIGSALVPLL